jgi:FMN phosphatase YigB (HAD superfamily)
VTKLTRQKSDVRAILFDLDGTLLKVQMSEFIPRYIAGLAACCDDLVTPKRFQQAMLGSIRMLIQCAGDGLATNAQRVFAALQERLEVPEEQLRERFEHYRQTGLADLQPLVSPIPLARAILEECRAKQVALVLATNPVFPRFMIDARVAWGNLDQQFFHHQTSFENSRFCKPHPGYFREICTQLGLAPQECLMVGNDTQHDLAASAVGMPTFLVDTWIVEREGPHWPCPNRGDHAALQGYLREVVS